MWMPTKAEAVEIYAGFWSARYGMTASSSAREMATSLERKGDMEGHKIWTEVANAVDRRHQEKRRAAVMENITTAS
jgi:hypothetical protein